MKNRFLSWIQKILRPAVSSTIRLATGLFAAILFGIFTQIPLCANAANTANTDSKAAQIHLKDGEYTIAVDLEGGTGRASITSPATLIVKDGTARAQIQWSSSKYDYMLVEEEKYLPINEEGNSVFEIPITVFDEAMPVVADTTAMSVPHEVEYTLTFHSDTITANNETSISIAQIIILGVIVVILVCVIGYFATKRKRK